MRTTRFAVLLVLPALLGSGTSANTLSAPDTVYADENGDFAYLFTCTVTPDSTTFAVLGWDGVANVSGGLHGDCFCFPNCRRGPGEDVTFGVTGSLVEPTAPGTVDSYVVFCDGDPELHVVTTVVPQNPAPALPASWGWLKACYR